MSFERAICYLVILNMLSLTCNFIRTENYWYIPPVLINMLFVLYCSVIYYRREKRDNQMIHQCRFRDSSTVCFEINNELWIKEIQNGNQREGRTYKVNFCPECGFQLPKSRFDIKLKDV